MEQKTNIMTKIIYFDNNTCCPVFFPFSATAYTQTKRSSTRYFILNSVGIKEIYVTLLPETIAILSVSHLAFATRLLRVGTEIIV